MEEMMKLDRKSGVQEEVPFINPTRKAMKEMLMPQIGEMIDNHKVTYINYGQFRFSAVSVQLPVLGDKLESNGRIYEVERIDPAKGQFNAVFKGFKENPVVEAPVEIEDDLVKVI